MVLGESSTTGKTTSAKLAERMIKLVCDKCAMKFPRVASNFTDVGLNRFLLSTENGTAWLFRDEADGFFKKVLSRAENSGIAESLTDLFTNDVVYKRMTAHNFARDLPDENRVCLNVLFMGTPSALYSTMRKEQFESGFLHRFLYCDLGRSAQAPAAMFANEGGVIHDGVTQEFYNTALHLAEIVRWWQKQAIVTNLESGRAQIRFSEPATELFNSVFERVHQGIIPSLSHENSAFERFKMQAIKIAGILTAAECERFISAQTASYALKYAYGYHQALLRVFDRIGMTRFQLDCEDVFAYIKTHDKISEVELRRHFASFKPSDWEAILSTLKDCGRIVRGLGKIIRAC
jgi:hypothetical protein